MKSKRKEQEHQGALAQTIAEKIKVLKERRAKAQSIGTNIKPKKKR